jgi:hypothetical protein
MTVPFHSILFGSIVGLCHVDMPLSVCVTWLLFLRAKRRWRAAPVFGREAPKAEGVAKARRACGEPKTC